MLALGKNTGFDLLSFQFFGIQRLAESDKIQVTVVIDADEDTCRIGYGDSVFVIY